MTDKAPTPFKSGVWDFEALNKRVKELGIRPIAGDDGDKNGVDIKPQPEPPADIGWDYG